MTSFGRVGRHVALAALLLGAASCGSDGPTGNPSKGRASVNLGPLFQTGSGGVERRVAKVRFVISLVVPPPKRVITDVTKTISDDAGSDPVVSVEFPLQGDDAQYEVTITALNNSGEILYQAGPIPFDAGDLSGGGDLTLNADVDYVGPGSDAIRVVASPHTLNLIAGATGTITAQAFGPNNAVISRALFDFSVTGGSNIITVDENGTVTAGNTRGTATVQVRIGSVLGPSDVVTVNVSGAPSQIVLVSGGNQTGSTGQALNNPVIVKVVASDNSVVAGVTVTFAGGNVSPATAVTDANGLAQTTWTLNQTVGQQSITASVQGVAQSLAINATGVSSILALVSGGGQSGFGGTQLSQPIVVSLMNGNNPIVGATVNFAASNGGSVSQASVTTDANGRAQVNWTLAFSGGSQQTLTVTSTGASGSPLTVTATSSTGALTVQFLSVLPSAITTAEASTIIVQVTAPGNLPVVGAAVTFSSSGSGNTFNPVTATTNAQGRATTVFSSSTVETKTITATVSGTGQNAALPVVAPYNAAGFVLQKVSGDNQSVHYGTVFGAPLVVRVLDARGQPVVGALIDWGTANGNLRRATDANGMSSNSYQLPNDPVTYPAGIPLPIDVILVGSSPQITVRFNFFAF